MFVIAGVVGCGVGEVVTGVEVGFGVLVGCELCVGLGFAEVGPVVGIAVGDGGCVGVGVGVTRD